MWKIREEISYCFDGIDARDFAKDLSPSNTLAWAQFIKRFNSSSAAPL
jgi:hypothetical protein